MIYVKDKPYVPNQWYRFVLFYVLGGGNNENKK